MTHEQEETGNESHQPAIQGYQDPDRWGSMLGFISFLTDYAAAAPSNPECMLI